MTNKALWQAAYSTLLVPTMSIALKVAAGRSQKLQETVAGHKELWHRLETAIKQRDTSKKLIWFHVASAGEFQQAEPLIKRFIADGKQCALTITSLSG
ncbi:MAG: glycosyltransferase N-terminal domain-containing protein, partial [Gammaproteobacteria bacterium]|nr:glycosyltransferase N-terminal domain-containing protein [Gammaproteobacteria bacterium]